MTKTVFVLTAVMTLGASLKAQTGMTIAGTYIPAKYFSYNAGLGLFYSVESLSGGSGEGIIEQNLPEVGKAFYNFTKTGSNLAGGVRAVSNIKGNEDLFLQILNSGNFLKSTDATYMNGKKTINFTKKSLNGN